MNKILASSIILAVTCVSPLSAQNLTFGSWSLICADKAACGISQLVAKDQEAKQIVLGANVNFFFGKENPTLLLRLPANTYQKAGIGIKIDKNKPIRVKISNCDSEKCESLIKIDQQLMHELLNGKVAQIAIALADKKQYTMPLVLDGFKQAYQALIDSQA